VSGPPELNRITTGFDFFVIGLSADGRRLVANENYVSAQNLHKVSHLSAETSVWSDALPVTTGEQIVETVAISPDGRWIAYGSNISGDVNIFMMPLPEGSAVQVTTDPAFDFVSGWSPDSKSILFYSLRNGTRDVFLADINDLSIQSIYQRDDDLWFPSMSSDGQFIGFASGTIPRDYEIIRRGEDGSWGDPKIVATNVHTANAFSPKGNMLVLIYQGGGVAIVDISVEPPREVFQSPLAVAAPVWSPVGNTVFVRGNDADGWGLWALEVKTGEFRKIFSGGVTVRGSLTFAADNEFLYFTKLEQTTNIWVLDLVYE
jgi:Tol biopolymer transport system component